MSDGLRRVLDLAAPGVRAALAAGELAPGAVTTPLAVAAQALAADSTLVVTATSNEAEALRDGVAALLGANEEVALWPGWDTHPLERVSPDAAVMAARALLRWRLESGDRPRVMVAAARALSQVLAPDAPAEPLEVRVGAAIDRDEFVAALARRGFRREGLVEHRAEFAVRGGIVDVWSAHAESPVRLDLFGDDLERLSTFDIANQRSLVDLASTVIAPAREWVPTRATRARAGELADLAPWGRVAFDRLAEGQLFDGMEGWMSLFVERVATVVDLVGDASVLLVEPSRVRRRVEDLLAEERELADTVAATWRADQVVPLLHAPLDAVLAGRDVAVLEPGAGADRVHVAAPPVVQGDPARLAAPVRPWSPRRRGVVLTNSAAGVARVADQLRAEGLEVTTNPDALLDVRVSVLESTLPHGFSLDDPEVVVWSETDLTGRRAVHR
ncbi:MAG: transcription-repair coupling factor, partial [Acidimicrobiales bacterium]